MATSCTCSPFNSKSAAFRMRIMVINSPGDLSVSAFSFSYNMVRLMANSRHSMLTLKSGLSIFSVINEMQRSRNFWSISLNAILSLVSVNGFVLSSSLFFNWYCCIIFFRNFIWLLIMFRTFACSTSVSKGLGI